MAELAVPAAELAVTTIVETAVETAVAASVDTAVEVAVAKAVESAVAAAVEAAVGAAIAAEVAAAVAAAAVTGELAKATYAPLIKDAIERMTKAAVDAIVAQLTQDFDPARKVLANPSFRELSKLNFLNFLPEAPPPVPPARCCEVLAEIQALGAKVPFWLFTIASGETSYGAVEVLPASDVDSLQSDPLVGTIVRGVLGKFKPVDLSRQPAAAAAAAAPGSANFRGLCSWLQFPGARVYNVDGSSIDRRASSWVKFWEWFFEQANNATCVRDCFIASPPRAVKRIVGGHLELEVDDGNWYMLPICSAHNNKQYDRGASGGIMTTTPTAWAVRMPVHPNFIALAADVAPAPSDVAKTLDTFAGVTLKQVLPGLVRALMAAVADAVRDAGEDAKNYTKSEGSRILGISLIPVYGWVKGPIELSHMKENCLAYFQVAAYGRVMITLMNTEQQQLQGITDAADTAATVTRQSPEWKAALAKLFPPPTSAAPRARL